MKQTIIVVCLLAFFAPGMFGAEVVNLDGMVLFGTSDWEKDMSSTRDLGVFVAAGVELYPQIVLDGLFFLGLGAQFHDGDEYQSLAESDEIEHSALFGGAKYLLLSDTGVMIYAGGGYSTFYARWQQGGVSLLNLAGSGFYGKLGLSFQLMDAVTVLGDASYVPLATFADDHEGVEGTVLNARIGVSYNVSQVLGLQASLVHNAIDAADVGAVRSTLLGAGVVLRF